MGHTFCGEASMKVEVRRYGRKKETRIEGSE
jgi:hypothetical protein